MQREAKEKSAKGKRHRSYKGEENHNKIGRGNFTEKTYPKRKFFLDFATLLISFSFFFFFFSSSPFLFSYLVEFRFADSAQVEIAERPKIDLAFLIDAMLAYQKQNR